MNKVILMGRLTKDPDVRWSQGEKSVAIGRFTIAVDRKFKKEGDSQTADFINCLVLGKTAEFAEKYLKKGVKIALEGRIQTGSYTNKDGVKVYTTEVMVESVEFAESKASSTANSTAESVQTTAPDNDGFMNIPDNVDDEGLPFN